MAIRCTSTRPTPREAAASADRVRARRWQRAEQRGRWLIRRVRRARLVRRRTARRACARALLTPAERVFGGDRRRARHRCTTPAGFARTAPAIPAVSVGNLTVGGTGKTPDRRVDRARARGARRAAGDRAARLRRRRAARARALNPDVPVIVGCRIASRGVREARAAGADVAVLDDAFQHRRVAARSPTSCSSAPTAGRGDVRLLPAGPWREPLERASARDARRS